MSDEKWSKILKYFAAASAVIALVEGFLYFDFAELGWWPYFVNTVQNAVHTFLFDADISAADAYSFIGESIPLFTKCVGCLYLLVVLVAPVCSTVAVYSAFVMMLHRNINPFMIYKREPVLIFGEHESLTAAIDNEDSRKYHFYLVTKGAVQDDSEELELLRKQTVIIRLDDYEDYDNNIEIIKSKLRLKKLKRIVIAQKTMADTLTLYMWICDLVKEGKIPADVKVYALCCGFGGERVLEQIYEGSLKQEGLQQLITYDSYEISARKILAEHMPASENGNVHAVLTGFTPLAQQIAANMMNEAVVSAGGRVTIDIIDAKVDDGRGIFARRFSPDYLKMDDNCWKIAGESADGQLLIRFHKADPKGRAYRELLAKLHGEESFTYAAIFLPNADDALSAMLDLKQVLDMSGAEGTTPVGLRIDANGMLAENLESAYEGLFTFDERSGNVTMDDIFYETVDSKAKVYNYIYNTIRLADESECAEPGAEPNGPWVAEEIDHAWKSMQAFQRTSSRMLADHAPVKAAVAELALLDASIGENGSVLKRVNSNWIMYGSDEDFLKRLAKCPELEKLAILEHRRWCYAMAACGWSYAPGKKDGLRKTNPCMVPWEKLKETQPHMCKYDLMPYMYLLLEQSRT